MRSLIDQPTILRVAKSRNGVSGKPGAVQRHPDVGLIMHTDRGSQYASKKYRKLLKAYAMIASMSGKANCWDNGVPRTPGRRCSNRDESVASRILVAGPGSKLRRAAEVKSLGSERRRKGAVKASSVG
jgi:transposase InsO family protein